MYAGVLTALVTPFADGRVDERALRELVEAQLAAGIHGQVVCGTTGEAAAMSEAERLTAMRLVVEQVAGRVPVIAGTGTNNTLSSVEMTEKAAELGVDGVLVVTPYYVKPPQRGLVEHFAAVAGVGLPVVAYNVPSRTGVSITPETAAALAGLEGVVALKEASADLVLDSRIMQAVGDGLQVLSGDDFTFLPLLALGGAGCISVVSNVAPAEFAMLYDLFREGDLAAAREIHYRLLPLMGQLFSEANPIPVKAALAMMGQIGWDIRVPLSPLAEDARPALRSALIELGFVEAES
jgi:4-hydroxy-tetrahydrodipicolinate synthase